MRILVTGTQGQVARSLIERATYAPGIEIEAVGRPALDLADPEGVVREIERRRPDIVVSAAAYTAVDMAEDEPDLAMQVNADGTGAVARGAALAEAPVIHLSTDYVFAGDKAGAYTEEDAPAPRTAYGRSKLAGEEAVAAANPQHVILRTAWVYSPFGRNFVKTMLGLAEQRSMIGVVADQVGNPTSALDIADGVLHVAKGLAARRDQADFGIFHLAGSGSTAWSGFAEHVFSVSRAAGGPWAKVDPIRTSDYPTKAVRPPNSRLDAGKLHRAYGWSAPDWTVSCEGIVRRLVAAASVREAGSR